MNILFTIFLTFWILPVFAQNIDEPKVKTRLELFATCKNQWTGIAISKQNNVFVNFPRWSEDTPISVAEIINGEPLAFPNLDWNNWDGKTSSKNKFICVQSILIDKANTLWILDTGYELSLDSTKGAYLYCFNIQSKKLLKKYHFPISIITGTAYLNDFRIDNKNDMVYITDSRVGGIVILNLKTNEIRRVLSKHPSTLAEIEKIIIEGYERKHPVHSDGLELDKKNEYLYYCALMGENIYRVRTKDINNKNYSEAELGNRVEKYFKTGANDGIIFDKFGNLFLSSLERNAVSRISKNKVFEEVITDKEIQWPDSFAFDNNNNLYFTTSQIHIPKDKRTLYKIFKLKF